MITASLIVLIVTGIALVNWVALRARLEHRLLGLPTLAILTFLVVNVLSGIVHLVIAKGANRGYYDLLNPIGTVGPQLLVPTAGTVLAATGLVWGLRAGRISTRSGADIVWRRGDRWLLLLGLLMLPITLAATASINAYVEANELSRVIGLSGGQARVGFLSQWSVWAITFICVGLLATRARYSEVRVAGLLAFGVASMAATLSWTGGRAATLVFALPLLVLGTAMMPRYKWVFGTALTVSAVIYLRYLTDLRTSSYSTPGFDLVSAIDWQLGRFSMMGYAEYSVSQRGFMWGATYYSGFASSFNGILEFIGTSLRLPPADSITNRSGADLVGSPELQYIVPGLNAEAYANFGFPGVLLVNVLLGWGVSRIDAQALRASTVVQRLALVYIGGVFVYCIPSQSGSLFGYLGFLGLPMISIFAWDRYRKRRSVAPSNGGPSSDVASFTHGH